jgi:hypothetical protein
MNKRNRYKQFWFLIVKLSIVFGAGYFTYKQTLFNNQLPLSQLVVQIKMNLLQDRWILPVLLLLSLLNWIFEIYKWQTLVGTIHKISFRQAAKQSLGSHTLSLVTPFKTGEYGGKALYFQKVYRKRIIVLNFIGNAAQLFITLVLGIFGLVFFLRYFDVPIHPHKLRRIAYFIAIIIASFFAGDKISSYFGSLNYYQRFISYIKKLENKIKIKVVLIALIRYVLFSHQFYFLLVIFGIEIQYEMAMILIFSMYFLATMLPAINLFDFIIKGSVAIYLFSFLHVNEISIISIITLMWLLNFAVPALIGSYFVLIFKTNTDNVTKVFPADSKKIFR